MRTGTLPEQIERRSTEARRSCLLRQCQLEGGAGRTMGFVSTHALGSGRHWKRCQHCSVRRASSSTYAIWETGPYAAGEVSWSKLAASSAAAKTPAALARTKKVARILADVLPEEVRE